MWIFNTDKRKLRKKIRAEFEARGLHVETKFECFCRWLKKKWDRFGSI